jgi:orotidine-5'-phosphate decarboxylase
MPHRRIVLPLDVASEAEARALARPLAPHVGVLKVGLELFTASGPSVLGLGAELGLDVFLDLKLHDIPETVERAVSAAAAHGVRYLTVHASGGPAMLRRAAARAAETSASAQPLTILAVTVLTSLSDADLAAVGVPKTASAQVLALAELAWAEGVRGFVCSPLEVAALRAAHPTATLVVPGVRPAGASAGDQQRVATPARAIRDGADLLVVGRPIRDAADPIAAARSIAAEIEGAKS